MNTPLTNIPTNNSTGDKLSLNDLFQHTNKTASIMDSKLNSISKKLGINDLYFKSIKDSIDSLRVLLTKLKNENTILRAEVDELRSRVEKLEKVHRAKGVLFDLIREAQERISRER